MNYPKKVNLMYLPSLQSTWHKNSFLLLCGSLLCNILRCDIKGINSTEDFKVSLTEHCTKNEVFHSGSLQ